ncbi:hypothetical protein E1A91_D04G033400v1, partial [Gossypium mustelinum]
MASSHSNTHTEAAKLEQIITEFFYKSLLIILESRSPYVSSPRDKWFNLALRECPSELENFDLCRQSNFEPVVSDVILEQKPLDWDPVTFSPKRDLVKHSSSKDKNSFFWNSDQEESGCEAKGEKVIERWFVQHESRKGSDCSSGSRRSSSNNLSALYKKLILLLRSLYVTFRLLPAYKIFRDLNSSGQIRAFKLVPRVSSSDEYFTQKDEAEMQRIWITPVDTSCGRLCLSVLYRSSISDKSSVSSTPMPPQFIPDYVGSPLTDPLRRFPSLPVSQGSPSSLPFSRRHSWSFDRYKASPPSVSLLPSPTHSESHALNTNFDEYWPSPNFSASPSPSPPIRVPGGHLSKALLRSESAPVNISVRKLAGTPALSCKQNLPSPPLKISRADISWTDNNMGPMKSGATIEKLFSFGKGDGQKYSGQQAVLTANHTSVVSCKAQPVSVNESYLFWSLVTANWRNMSLGHMVGLGRISVPDSYDRRGNPSDPNEAGLFMNRKSQDAAVGALVRMLKEAPPLRQDIPSSINFSEASRPEMWNNNIQEKNQNTEAVTVEHDVSSIITSSRLVASMTTADALEELRSYKEMKNLLLSEG